MHLSRFLTRPSYENWEAGLRCLQYLNSTKGETLWYKRGNTDHTLRVYSDADLSNEYSAKSVTGYIIMIGKSVLSWTARLQTTVSQYTFESECIALNSATKESLFIARMIEKVTDLCSTIERDMNTATKAELISFINDFHGRYDEFNHEKLEFDEGHFANTEMVLKCDNTRLVESLQKGNLASSKD